ncbi:MAG: signal peptidase II [Planctomycetota bacterium]|jgi:signal peptidase II
MTQPDTNPQPTEAEDGPLFSMSHLPAAKAQIVFWLLVVVGVGLDLWTKQAVFNWLSAVPGNEFSIIKGVLTFVMRENSGAAFSIAAGQTVALVTVSIVAFFVVVAIFLFGGIVQKTTQVALGLFTAGIIGNLYDRIFNDGFVRDFIDIVYWPGKHWPAFNVADSMLCIAVGLLLISNITSAYCRKPAHPQK